MNRIERKRMVRVRTWWPFGEKAGLSFAVWAMWAQLPAERALAHGSEELEIFEYLLEEPGFLRLTALILGVLIFLLGAFIVYQGKLEWRRIQEEPEGDADAADTSAFKLMAPGAIFATVGVVIILGAAFVLPDRLDTGAHDHPVATEKPTERKP
jgi:hypothetical protein